MTIKNSSPYPPPSSLAWAMWGLGAALYFIAFYQRVAPAVITTELSQEFGLTAAALGNLSAFYFYSYVAMQIPTGLLADRFGPRVLLTIGCIVAAIGTAVFAIAPTTSWADFGRLLIGGSVGVAFVCMLKLASHWMPARQFALTSGVALAVGVFGATIAGAPLRLLVNDFGWRHVMWASAAITLLLAVVSWLLVRDDPAERGYLSYASHQSGSQTQAESQPKTQTQSQNPPSIFDGLKAVLAYRNVLLLLIIPGVMSGLTVSFSGLWGVPFLTTHYALTETNAAGLCSILMIAWAIGCLTFGALSDRIGRRKPIFIGGVFIALSLWAALIFSATLSYPLLIVILAAIGFFCGSFIVTFAFAKESVPARYAGTVSGVSNMGVMLGPMCLQPLIGVVLDAHWQGAILNGKRIFDLASYQQAFSMVLVWGAVSLLLLLFTRETYCKQQA